MKLAQYYPRTEAVLELLRQRVTEKTVAHSLSVAEMMLSLCEPLGMSASSAVAAGLLHDLCKSMKGPQLLAAAEQWGLSITPIQRAKPTLLHGPVAAEESRRELGIRDDGIYEAIYWHTTGRPELGTLGLALYVADFAEPLRRHPEAEQTREILAAGNFEAALRFVAHSKYAYVRARPSLDPTTEAFHAWLENWKL
ncbi:MAG: bis(5'-nucleosyl)-tetraphosphatase (symmetrical) YqeK [Candidatus Hydrogenedentes bacterium]|nr:bis(5'-nucleosyl)-tetraphosphatase (symmetrical) YqeK [Candidatus Hydrogenedentota bacterium]